MSDATTEPELAIEIVAASMGYALAKLSEDRTWLLTLDSSVGLETALRWDAEEFMKHRGRFIIADIEAAARRAGMEEAAEIVKALHRPQIYYRHPDHEGDGGDWFLTLDRLRDEMERAWESDHTIGDGPFDWDAARLSVEEKTYCAHCMEVVEQAVEPYEVPFSPIAQWPCWTIRAIDPGEQS